MKNLSTTKHGQLTVIKLSHVKQYPTQTKAYWFCKCDCGNEKVIRGEHLTSGRTVSCGCAAKKNAVKHGLKGTPEYNTWLSVRSRIGKPSAVRPYYAGIKLCARWDDFRNFLEDMGAKPTPEHSIDRIDPFGDYSPDNCRWATRSEQMKNQRRNYVLQRRYAELESVVDWDIFQQRVRVLGWSPSKAASTPKMKNQFG